MQRPAWTTVAAALRHAADTRSSVAYIDRGRDWIWQEMEETSEDVGLSEQAVLALCRIRLADGKRPRPVAIRPQLPITPAGKIHKSALRADRTFSQMEPQAAQTVRR